MPQKESARDTCVISFRIKKTLRADLERRAGGEEHLTEWVQSLLATAAAGRAPGTGALQQQGYEAGKRQGWAHANRVFREALAAALVKLKGEK